MKMTLLGSALVWMLLTLIPVPALAGSPDRDSDAPPASTAPTSQASADIAPGTSSEERSVVTSDVTDSASRLDAPDAPSESSQSEPPEAAAKSAAEESPDGSTNDPADGGSDVSRETSTDASPMQTPPDPALAIASANTFGLALFKRLAAKDGNVLLSPYALQDALAFLYAASAGETRAEIRAALQYPEQPGFVLASVAHVRRGTERREGPVLVRAGASLWVQQGIPLDADLLERSERQVGLAAGRMDLVEGIERARNAMNAWSQFQTGGLVSEPLPEGDLRRDALVILLNTFYLRSAWHTPFPEANTAPATFAGPSGSVRLPMMRRRERLDYYDAGHTQVVRIPLAERGHELLLLLPRDADGMARLLQRLTFPELERWESRMWIREIDLHLPRLSVSAGLNLIPDLRGLGLEDAFSERGDFSPLTGDVRVAVDRFRHTMTFVFGEAGISMSPLSTPPPAPAMGDAPADAVPVHVDRPFVFLLRDTRSGILLSMGRIDTPAGVPVPAAGSEESPHAAETKAPPRPTFRSRPGFGPWDFGMPIDIIPGMPGGPYRYIRQTRQFMTEHARWNMTDGHTAILSFNEEGNLSGVRLQLFTGRNPDDIVEPLRTLIQALQERYTGVILPDADLPATATDDPDAISVAMRARVERLREDRPHAPAEASLYPRYQPPQTWISGHLLYEESIGYAVFLQYQWDPRFPGTPLPDPAGDAPSDP